MTLYEKLQQLNESDMYPLHMPGHKRNQNAGAMAGYYGIDITEIDGFDDLHAPNGVIKDMEDRLAKIYGAEHAFISVNGSTAANEAAILSACKKGDKVLLARNCHKSVYYALELTEAEPIYIVPKIIKGTTLFAPLATEQIEAGLRENPDCRAVILSSPTYDGITADIKGISEITHKYGAVFIVDCAHGAHFGFGGGIPDSPVGQGADLVIMSLHKMLPAPTQTAVLFTCSERADRNRTAHYMNVFQSSSPSYILMAGIGECIRYLEDRMAEDIVGLSARCDELRNNLRNLKNIDVSIPETKAGSSAGGSQTDSEDKRKYTFDKCKLVIRSNYDGVSGRMLYDLLREKYHIQCEMCGMDYCLGLLTVMDNEAGFARITDALKLLDGDPELVENCKKTGKSSFSDEKTDADDKKSLFYREISDNIVKLELPGRIIKVHDALFAEKENVRIEESDGRIAASYITVYPPGMPILVPGEQIDEAVISYINKVLELGLGIQGITEEGIPVVTW